MFLGASVYPNEPHFGTLKYRIDPGLPGIFTEMSVEIKKMSFQSKKFTFLFNRMCYIVCN